MKNMRLVERRAPKRGSTGNYIVQDEMHSYKANHTTDMALQSQEMFPYLSLNIYCIKQTCYRKFRT